MWLNRSKDKKRLSCSFRSLMQKKRKDSELIKDNFSFLMWKLVESCWNWVLRRETDVFHYTELIWIINLVFSFDKMNFHWHKCSHVCSPLSPSRALGCSGPWPTRQSIFLTRVSSRTPPAVLWRLTMKKYLPFPYSSFAYDRTIHFDFETCVYILVIRSFTTFSPRLKSSSVPYISKGAYTL